MLGLGCVCLSTEEMAKLGEILNNPQPAPEWLRKALKEV
jgi:hypothetical protein